MSCSTDEADTDQETDRLLGQQRTVSSDSADIDKVSDSPRLGPAGRCSDRRSPVTSRPHRRGPLPAVSVCVRCCSGGLLAVSGVCSVDVPKPGVLCLLFVQSPRICAQARWSCCSVLIYTDVRVPFVGFPVAVLSDMSVNRSSTVGHSPYPLY